MKIATKHECKSPFTFVTHQPFLSSFSPVAQTQLSITGRESSESRNAIKSVKMSNVAAVEQDHTISFFLYQQKRRNRESGSSSDSKCISVDSSISHDSIVFSCCLCNLQSLDSKQKQTLS